MLGLPLQMERGGVRFFELCNKHFSQRIEETKRKGFSQIFNTFWLKPVCCSNLNSLAKANGKEDGGKSPP